MEKSGISSEGKMWDIIPFITMFIIEGCTIALTITAKSAMAIGMSQFVFVAYSNALSSILLLLYCLFYHRDSMKKVFNADLLTRFFLLGLTGITIAQNLAFTGLRDSSPIVVCAMGLLLPSFQFFLNLVLRKAQLKLKNKSTRIKIIGVLVSFIGATTVAVYLGPSILNGPIIGPIRFRLQGSSKPFFIFISTTEEWMFGTFLLACATFFIAIWSMIQVSTFTRFPDMMVIVTCYTIFGTIQTFFVDIIANGDLNAWKLKWDLELLIIVLTAIFGTLVRSRIQAWIMGMKGPMYVAMFKPAGIFWANFFGESFFGTLCYGSVIGTIVVGVGYYTVLWGVKEEAKKAQEYSVKPASSDIKTPLLQNQNGDEQV
ncbi:WAT1-related protein At1g70260-like [Amaranthus tricolor]|uniref:WAT1-related protein At1g70260-like n=1 Tax=Amaranthus tricolor TaxID=29722 RepID=UPI002583B87A|nr:WAT1-related protein At1g70260-like [Amaranthus tricolor]